MPAQDQWGDDEISDLSDALHNVNLDEVDSDDDNRLEELNRNMKLVDKALENSGNSSTKPKLDPRKILFDTLDFGSLCK